MDKSKKIRTAIEPTREEDFPEWFQQVVRAAELAESSPVRGCMVIKPWGFGIWESLQRQLDDRIKALGHDNAYFPLFIPLSFLQKEAQHVEGFAKECAVVTHHRLEEKDGKLVPSGPLEEPLIVRPTSETIIGDAFSRWVQSYRDLPLLINQWANVCRWEMRPRILLRTAEFLWQEGHTAHATEEEAVEETLLMLEEYRKLSEAILAIPVITGKKSPGERFPGAVETYTFEMMMQDRKALQGGTSHYLGQNFSKASNIQFSTKSGGLEHAYTTSWGVTTRLIGAMVMVHSDDDGLRIPPRAAHKQVAILPVTPKADSKEAVLQASEKLRLDLQEQRYHGQPVRAILDDRDVRGGEKSWHWIKKGIPLRVEIGPRDLEAGMAVVYRRDLPHKEKLLVPLSELPQRLEVLLDEVQKNYFSEALAWREQHIYRDIQNFEELKAFFTPKNAEKPEIHGGFVLAKWCGDPETEALLEELKVTIRCLPLEQSGTTGRCVLTGREATLDAIFAKSY